MTEDSLILFTKAAQMLAEADTIQKTKELKNMALTALEWSKRKKLGKETEMKCYSYALAAERKMGEMLAATERSKGGNPNLTRSSKAHVEPPLSELGVTRKESSNAQLLAKISDEEFKKVCTKEKSLADIRRESKKAEMIQKLESIEAQKIKQASGLYDVIVIDPPWEMTKINRDCRPNQVEFDYPTMPLAEIESLEIPAADDCHLFLWTTQKYLPISFDILDTWGFNYICTFVWHKNGGFQPIGLPQYNCEFILYARKGTPEFIDTKAFPLCFNAERKGHSVKPEEFYEMVRRVTAGRRLDMFNRRLIEGFDGYGLEAK